MIRFQLFLILLTPTIHLAAQYDPSVEVLIHGLNLSEDMSTLSSRNDELLLLIYGYDDSLKVDLPLTSAYFVLDSANRKKTVRVPCQSSTAVLLLLELDTNRTPEQLEPLVRKNLNAVLRLARKGDRMGIQKLIGDDDVMGYRILPKLCDPQSFSISCRFKLDKYAYGVSITRER